MNGVTIDSILSKCLGKVFKGVYSFDQWRLLPITHPAAYVFNTMPQHENFGHWIGIYIYNSGKAVFFDTFGRTAEQLGFHMFLEKHSSMYTYNSKVVQNLMTLTCGQHVILFLMHAKQLSKWNKLMKNDLLKNDNFVYEYFSRHFDVNTPFFPNIDMFL